MFMVNESSIGSPSLELPAKQVKVAIKSDLVKLNMKRSAMVSRGDLLCTLVSCITFPALIQLNHGRGLPVPGEEEEWNRQWYKQSINFIAMPISRSILLYGEQSLSLSVRESNIGEE